MRHQVRRKQHALDSPERQRLVGGEAFGSSRLQRRALGTQLSCQLRQLTHRVGACPQSQAQTAYDRRHAIGKADTCVPPTATPETIMLMKSNSCLGCLCKGGGLARREVFPGAGSIIFRNQRANL